MLGVSLATPPLTPLANLKVLIAAASTALENEVEQQVIEVDDGIVKLKETTVEDGGGRKMRSLAILCKRLVFGHPRDGNGFIWFAHMLNGVLYSCIETHEPNPFLIP